MTIEELKHALELIPKKGVFNIARRNAIIAKIYELSMKENTK